MVSLPEEYNHVIEDKEKRGQIIVEPEKARSTSEFVKWWPRTASFCL